MKVKEEATTIEAQAAESSFKNLLKRRWKLLIMVISLLAVGGGAVWWGLQEEVTAEDIPEATAEEIAAQKEAAIRTKRMNDYLDQFK